MSVLVDTPVWSALLRRPPANSPEAVQLRQLILARRARIIGPVRQELLSGVRERWQFESLRRRLRSFADVGLSMAHFERAAEFSNRCRSRGIQGSGTDFLICAVAELNGLTIFTTDQDFTHFAAILPIRLLS
jgi:predicted nucleic acid-binding protein